MEMLLQGIFTGLAVGAIYGLSALGFVIIYKSTGILNVAQGGLVMLGSFFCYTFSVTIGMPLWLSFIAAMASAFLLGLIIAVRWPVSGLFIIGLFSAIELIIHGWSYILIALAVKGAPEALPSES